MEGYDSLTQLGKGSCGAVYLVRNQSTKKLYALKKIHLDESRKTRTKEAVLREARILSELKHPHIVAYHESFFDEEQQHLCILQDYCDGGTLDDQIRDAVRQKQYLPEKRIMQWFLQITLAVRYMHSMHVLHRDLKTENIFLNKTGTLCKLGDFGIAKSLDTPVEKAKTCVGTPCYLSPEMCQDIPYSSKADIWALGCMLYEMAVLKPAFDAQNLVSLFYKIVKGEFEPIPSVYSTELSDVLNVILVKSPEDRPSARGVLALPYIKTELLKYVDEKELLLQKITLPARHDSRPYSTPSLHNRQGTTYTLDLDNSGEDMRQLKRAFSCRGNITAGQSREEFQAKTSASARQNERSINTIPEETEEQMLEKSFRLTKSDPTTNLASLSIASLSQPSAPKALQQPASCKDSPKHSTSHENKSRKSSLKSPPPAGGQGESVVQSKNKTPAHKVPVKPVSKTNTSHHPNTVKPFVKPGSTVSLSELNDKISAKVENSHVGCENVLRAVGQKSHNLQNTKDTTHKLDKEQTKIDKQNKINSIVKEESYESPKTEKRKKHKKKDSSETQKGEKHKKKTRDDSDKKTRHSNEPSTHVLPANGERPLTDIEEVEAVDATSRAVEIDELSVYKDQNENVASSEMEQDCPKRQDNSRPNEELYQDENEHANYAEGNTTHLSRSRIVSESRVDSPVIFPKINNPPLVPKLDIHGNRSDEAQTKRQKVQPPLRTPRIREPHALVVLVDEEEPEVIPETQVVLGTIKESADDNPPTSSKTSSKKKSGTRRKSSVGRTSGRGTRRRSSAAASARSSDLRPDTRDSLMSIPYEPSMLDYYSDDFDDDSLSGTDDDMSEIEEDLPEGEEAHDEDSGSKAKTQKELDAVVAVAREELESQMRIVDEDVIVERERRPSTTKVIRKHCIDALGKEKYEKVRRYYENNEVPDMRQLEKMVGREHMKTSYLIGELSKKQNKGSHR